MIEETCAPLDCSALDQDGPCVKLWPGGSVELEIIVIVYYGKYLKCVIKPETNVCLQDCPSMIY